MNNLIRQKEILIAGLTPSFLEKPVLWFSENFHQIKNSAKTQIFFQKNTLFLRKDDNIAISRLLKQFDDLGYKKVSKVFSAGEFSKQGGIIDIFPINSEKIIRLDFENNRLEEIIEIEPTTLSGQKPKKSKEDVFNLGDYVVHLDHGIGIFRGVQEKKQNKYFIIEYAPPKIGGRPDLLFVPFGLKEKISPYLGFETPKIHRLGSPLWGNTRKKIKENIIEFAKELIAIYAKREMVGRKPYVPDRHLEIMLTDSFEYQETESQKKTISEIFKDLESQRPMDRIVVGDVGFGKTEVALRAAFRVALNGSQVALISPTTILAQQHFETFKNRLKKFPLNIERVSRLFSKKETKQTLADLKNGKIDIIIGTHRLLSPDIEFKNLGLLIIDEEQKFGVRQKEKMKKMRAVLDILSLSATPIPRTLSLALSSLRSLSRIDEAPLGRTPIKTFVLPFSKKIIQEAINYELQRGGQVFFLHNRIETIEAAKKNLIKILKKNRHGNWPKIETAHGRMNEKSLLKIIQDFREKKIQVLMATTIIENGLDLANVNTLIVEEGSLLGLAEAHQLRGRVGRGNRQAFAYFLYRSLSIPEKAKKRLETLRQMSHLGAGYEIATADLKIRGAGNILGAKQSGCVNAVGLNLYYQLLNEAIEKLKK
ncbi:MAG: DEAD/DEAH box helicase [Parcubacteria group bacterium]|nr:DEAD/DEAH box helicase [Parcubacteria group bacterium]